jgi:hypothetical protein
MSISFAETMQLDRFFFKKKVAAVAKKIAFLLPN